MVSTVPNNYVTAAPSEVNGRGVAGGGKGAAAPGGIARRAAK